MMIIVFNKIRSFKVILSIQCIKSQLFVHLKGEGEEKTIEKEKKKRTANSRLVFFFRHL